MLLRNTPGRLRAHARVRATRKLVLRVALLLGFALAFASAAHATDGILEINQTCAVQTGCFGDDTPGFPVSINDSVPGKSFRLTSDLVVTATRDGIRIHSDFVEIDLNGFRIVSAGCESATSMCNSVPGFSHGISTGSGAWESTVRNGSVIGMTGTGVLVGLHSRVENVTVKWSGRDGIRAYQNSTIVDNYTLENGIDDVLGSGAGIIVSAGSVVRSNRVVGNALWGIRAFGGGSVVSGNVAIENGGEGILTLNEAAEITGNLVNGNGSDGILADHGSTISGNTVSGNAARGIDAGSGDGSSVFDNAIFGNGSDGIYAGPGTSIQRNSVRINTGLGLNLLTGAVYRENRITINTGGNVVGGLNMGDNACDNATTCP